MVACITTIQSPLNFLLNQMLTRYCRPQLLELRHKFRRSVCCLCLGTLTCILVTGHHLYMCVCVRVCACVCMCAAFTNPYPNIIKSTT
jgi:hypothetical protein